jgi:LmbE family N-acetylglucosaminyl deacetylase
MQKILFGIFAHPDDEAFGPVATLLKEVQAGTELHLIVLTAGENGTNPDNLPNLGEVRLQEWHAAGELIGATSLHHLGYIDGALNNADHLEIASRLDEIVQQTVSGREGVDIEFMSLDLNGYTGHIDHIVAARSACLAFYRLREQGLPMRRIRLACLPRDQVPAVNTDFVFMQPGFSPDMIDETIDGSEFIDRIHEIMQKHYTQRNDYAFTTSMKGDDLAINHFVNLD